MSIVYAVPAQVHQSESVGATRADSRSYWIESLDGSVRVPFDNAPVMLTRGAVGLDEAPVDTVFESLPGVEGESVVDVRTLARPMLLPVAIEGVQAVAWEAKRRIKQVCRPGEFVSREGAFYLGCSSASGERVVMCQYVSGLEGESRSPNLDVFPLVIRGVDPFARDANPRTVEFSVGAATGVMVSANPAAAGPRRLGSSVVIGEAMPIDVVSGVPVWPRIDFVGPFSPLTVSASTGMSVSVPGGVPAGKTLTVVTDPRNKSIRLDGALAAGLVARGSRIGSPFQPGLNHLNVAATGATEESKIVLSWRGGWRSLW